MESKMFPEVPEDLSALADDELDALLKEHEVAAEMIDSNDEEFTAGLSAEEIIADYDLGLEQMQAIIDEKEARSKGVAAFDDEKAVRSAKRKEMLAAVAEAAEEPAEDDEGEEEEEAAEAEEEALVASAEVEETTVVTLRKPPRSTTREPITVVSEPRPVLVAAAGLADVKPGQELDRKSLALAYRSTAQRRGKPTKSRNGVEEKILVASVEYPFPDERKLDAKDIDANVEKLNAVLPSYIPGGYGRVSGDALVASGGLCAPLTPIYSMPNFAVQDRPVRDALPSFQADRGGVNVPAATFIGDITSAITVIEESEDALGGTFSTKSCQDMDCPAYTETAVTIISHCREYGNLNSMAWPEKVAHENDLTMAAHARSAEQYLLDRIKAQSIAVTNGADTLSALSYLVDGIVKGAFGIRSRLRMRADARFRALLPAVALDILLLDTVQTGDGNRFKSKGDLEAYLRSAGVDPVFYLDSPSADTSQIADAAQTAAALDPLPDNIQWALYPEGAFIHIDGGSLELGLVRDSTLNSTNDYQIFGESFENVALLAPAQAAYWVTTDLCAVGQFPPAGTARTCD